MTDHALPYAHFVAWTLSLVLAGCAAPPLASPTRRARQDPAHRRHLRGEPQLRQSVRPLPRAPTASPTRRRSNTRRSTTTASRCRICRRCGKARIPIRRFRNACRTSRSASTRRRSTCRCPWPTRDLIHKFYQQQEQINGGRNNRFAAVSDAGGLRDGLLRRLRSCRCGNGRGSTRSPTIFSWPHSAIRTSITSG